jgi:hypothetical protein
MDFYVLTLQSMTLFLFSDPPSSALDMTVDYDYALTTSEMAAVDKQLDMLEIPGKGRCYVFLAR